VHKINPSGRWWIKADGTDIQDGLRESMKNQWSGDVDWGDGDLESKQKEYLNYLSFVRGIGCLNRSSKRSIKEDLEKQLRRMEEEKMFLNEGHFEAKRVYKTKINMINVSEDSLFASAWDVEGYAKLKEHNEILSHNIIDITTRLDGCENIAVELSELRKKIARICERCLHQKERSCIPPSTIYD
jgi:hypothetical protein